ncbi:hypothetical protein [Lutimonas sp.]|uniref:hypothetical protein n=1 Tax=Lutimonas sp. TaxID=1872403 RepID=UPI003D9ADF8F
MKFLFTRTYNTKNSLRTRVGIGTASLTSLFVLLFLLTGLMANGQVSTKIDTTKIRIGEQFNYEIIVDQTSDVRFPKLELDSLNRIGVVTSHKIDSLRNQLIKKYTLTSFDSGRYVLPGQEIFIKNKKYLTDDVIIDVATVPVDTIKQPMFHIKEIENEPYLFSDYLNYFWGLIAALVIIGLILYFVLRDKPTEEEILSRIPPFDAAKLRLKELDGKKLISQNKIKLYYVELTDIVRTFIERELNIPALESTTDELIDTIGDFNASSKLNIPLETLEKLQKLLQEADLVKFAKSKPLQNEISLHRTDAEGIIDTLHPIKLETKEEGDDGE